MIAADPVASAEWDAVVADLDARGVLARSDRGILAAYCNAYSRLAGLAGSASTLTAPAYGGKSVKANPAMRLASQAARELAAFARELGLTPASRGCGAVAEAS
jgi:P27 family predicted phage terminase small subunit